jgi:hypothetical protein
VVFSPSSLPMTVCANFDYELGGLAIHLTFCSGQDISPLYLRTTSWNGVISGPLRIAQLQEPEV